MSEDSKRTTCKALQEFLDYPCLVNWLNIYDILKELGGEYSSAVGEPSVSIGTKRGTSDRFGPVPCIQTEHPFGKNSWGGCKCENCPLSMERLTGNHGWKCALNGMATREYVFNAYKTYPGEMIIAVAQFMASLEASDE